MATNETIPITVPIEQGLTDVASSAPASVTPGEYPKLSDSGPSVTGEHNLDTIVSFS